MDGCGRFGNLRPGGTIATLPSGSRPVRQRGRGRPIRGMPKPPHLAPSTAHHAVEHVRRPRDHRARKPARRARGRPAPRGRPPRLRPARHRPGRSGSPAPLCPRGLPTLARCRSRRRDGAVAARARAAAARRPRAPRRCPQRDHARDRLCDDGRRGRERGGAGQGGPLCLGRRLPRSPPRSGQRSRRVARRAAAGLPHAGLHRLRTVFGARVWLARRARLDRQEHAPHRSTVGQLFFSDRAAHDGRPARRPAARGRSLRLVHGLPRRLSHAGLRRAARARRLPLHQCPHDRRPRPRRACPAGRPRRLGLRLRRLPGGLSMESARAGVRRADVPASRRRGAASRRAARS